MAGHAPEPLGERFRVTVRAPRTHFRAAPDRVPGRVGPFDFRFLAHRFSLRSPSGGMLSSRFNDHGLLAARRVPTHPLGLQTAFDSRSKADGHRTFLKARMVIEMRRSRRRAKCG